MSNSVGLRFKENASGDEMSDICCQALDFDLQRLGHIFVGNGSIFRYQLPELIMIEKLVSSKIMDGEEWRIEHHIFWTFHEIIHRLTCRHQCNSSLLELLREVIGRTSISF